MCGPSSQEQSLSNEQSQFYNNLTNEYSTVFGENQQITSALSNAMSPILAAGPSQTGFSPSQLNAMTTQNIQGTATDYANAQKATAQILAGRGGGDTFLPSSVNANLLATNANAAAAEQSTNQLNITNADYARGYQNWQTAASSLAGTASLLNPTNYATTATSAGQQAFGSAQTMANQAFAPWSAAMGSLGSVAGLATGNLLRFGGGAGTTSNPASGITMGNYGGAAF